MTGAIEVLAVIGFACLTVLAWAVHHQVMRLRRMIESGQQGIVREIMSGWWPS